MKDLNLTVKTNSFVGVVGPVGSGKSSLMNALLGEMINIKGRVNINGKLSVAYVPQTAWIQNVTLRENILFGKPYEKKKYDRVIHACALKQDLAILKAGDQTEIGEKGINLSGGQKQRVNLARACYSDADLYFLDDPLSAVDSHVAKHLFDKVLSSTTGLLKDKTRILATNNLTILPSVDQVVVLKKGYISEIGSYKELMDRKQHFAEFVHQFSTNVEETNNERRGSGGSSNHEFSRSMSVTSNTSVEIDHTKSKLIEAEKAETGKVKFNVYTRYLKAITIPWLSLLVIGYIGNQLASVSLLLQNATLIVMLFEITYFYRLIQMFTCLTGQISNFQIILIQVNGMNF